MLSVEICSSCTSPARTARSSGRSVSGPLSPVLDLKTGELLSEVCVCVFARCQFSTFEQCQEWLKRLNALARPPSNLEDLFSFAFHESCMNVYASEKEQHGELCRPGGSGLLSPLPPHAPPSYHPVPECLSSTCRRTCDLLVQKRGGKDGLRHPQCLEDHGHQQQVQVRVVFPFPSFPPALPLSFCVPESLCLSTGSAPATLSSSWFLPGSVTKSWRTWQPSAPGRGFQLWFTGVWWACQQAETWCVGGVCV